MTPPLTEPTHQADDAHAHGVERLDLARIALVAVAAAAVWARLWEPVPQVSVIGLAALVAGGYPIFKEALDNLVERRMTMELSMTIALVAAAAVGEMVTALIITAFVLAAEILEGLTVERGRRAIHDLLDLLPRQVTVRRRDGIADVPLTALRPGDRVLIRPGGRVPVDGDVVDGHSFVDEAAITGEPLPVEKTSGATVFAGTINQAGALEVRATRLGADTSFGRIVSAIERAERSRAPIQATADRLAGYLVYFALGAAALTFLATRDLRATISVIIVAGACGVAAGTPLAILGGIGQAARRGAIVKGGLHLETLAAVDTVVLDKTGTVTLGTPEVRRVVPLADGVDERELLALAAAAERRSEHPLAAPILARAAAAGAAAHDPERFAYEPGLGITAIVGGRTLLVGNAALLERGGVPPGTHATTDDGVSRVWVARDGSLLGAIDVADAVRPEAQRAIARLQALGLEVHLFTGDTVEAARAVAGALGIDHVAAGLLPDEKQQRVEAIVRAGRTVAMIGDGINDAPALAQANVGVAMGSGTDVTRERADVLLLGNDLAKFVDTLAIARRTRRVIHQNFAGTLAVDTAGILLAAAGWLNPLVAALIHVGSELTFIMNSARLMPAVAARARGRTEWLIQPDTRPS